MPNPFPSADPMQGSWTMEMAKCVCLCNAPNLRFGFSQRTRVYDSGTGHSTEFSSWSDYEFGGVNQWIGNLYQELNTDPDNGGQETQVRMQIEIDRNGRAGVLRLRQIFAEDVGDTDPQTVLSFGELQTITIAATTGIIVHDLAFVPCNIGQMSVMVGPPGGGSLHAGFSAQRQAGYLKKKGFLRYKNQTEIAIYRAETVIAGGSPGCPADELEPRNYSGLQEFQAILPTSENGYLADTSGIYVNSLSPDLVEDNYASKPYLSPLDANTFGVSVYPSENEKQTSEKYMCSGNEETKFLNLALSSLYATEVLIDSVDNAIDLQLANGSNGGQDPEDPRVVHRHWKPLDGVHYERLRTTQFAGGIGGFDSMLGSKGEVITLTSICHFTKRGLGAGGGAAESTLTTSLALQASDDDLVGLAGRMAGIPTDSSPPLASPWEGDEYDNSDVILTKVTCKPNQLLCIYVPFVEDPAVLDLGYD